MQDARRYVRFGKDAKGGKERGQWKEGDPEDDARQDHCLLRDCFTPRSQQLQNQISLDHTLTSGHSLLYSDRVQVAYAYRSATSSPRSCSAEHYSM